MCYDIAFFNIVSGRASAPPALRFAPPVKPFLPLKKVPFLKKRLFYFLVIQRNLTLYNRMLQPYTNLFTFWTLYSLSLHLPIESFPLTHVQTLFLSFSFHLPLLPFIPWCSAFGGTLSLLDSHTRRWQVIISSRAPQHAAAAVIIGNVHTCLNSKVRHKV